MLRGNDAGVDLWDTQFKMAAALSFGSVMNFGEKSSNNSDSWQDANTALAELDKGSLICLSFYIISVFWDMPLCLTNYNF